MQTYTVLKVHPEDSVAVAIRPLSQGEVVEVAGLQIAVATDIPAGHKFALKAIAKGEKVIKYGAPIGYAVTDIACGEHVHAANIKTTLSESAEYVYDKMQSEQFALKAEQRSKEWEGRVPTIKAYRRSNGAIGIRNELWIVPTVGCVNKIAENLVSWAQDNLKKAPFYDGIHVWSHPYGCSQLGDDHEATRTILSDLVHHPNAGGVLVLSLGCENNTPESLRPGGRSRCKSGEVSHHPGCQ